MHFNSSSMMVTMAVGNMMMMIDDHDDYDGDDDHDFSDFCDDSNDKNNKLILNC